MTTFILEFYQTICSYLPKLLPGLPTSLVLTAISLLLAFVLATLFSVILMLKTPILHHIVKLYIVIFTGTPLLIQLYLIYYGPGQFHMIQESYPLIWHLISNVWFCAILALTLNSAAYTTLLFHGAFKAIPAGQWQACLALGMTRRQTLRLLLPYALKRALPSYSNEVILVFKSSSLAYLITLMDLMGYTKKLFGSTYDLNVYVIAGLIYLAVNSLLMIIMRRLESYFLQFEQH